MRFPKKFCPDCGMELCESKERARLEFPNGTVRESDSPRFYPFVQLRQGWAALCVECRWLGLFEYTEAEAIADAKERRLWWKLTPEERHALSSAAP